MEDYMTINLIICIKNQLSTLFVTTNISGKCVYVSGNLCAPNIVTRDPGTGCNSQRKTNYR